ncbi:LmeA family phospholipid-binding protein [Tolypothrix sp. VBCCA 56010]|uniref:LmeA family phospholipid-binding protein n=1 Tax=Tolypothrix sp. VBCCA 56010 TaxID=3137731 RepID=UPI003D7DA386
MFGGITGLKDPKGTDWGERMLNTVASQTIRHLFSQSESVEVFVRCYPSSKLLQGSIDSFKMNATGVVIRKDFPAEEISVETDAVSIDFSSVLSGKLTLKQPTQAIAKVVLSEEGINYSFKAELVKKRLLNLTVPALTQLSGGNPVSFPEIQVELLPENRLRIFAKADLGDRELVPLDMTVTIAIERRRRVSFKDPQIELDSIPEAQKEISRTLSVALADILDNMVDLDRFDLDGVKMRLNRLETEGKQLIFSGYAEIERIPRTG